MNLRDQHGGVSEIGKAAGHRLTDAQVLLSNGRWRAAMYMAGYAVECRLKAKLMRKYGCDHLRELGAELARRGKLDAANDVYTHSLELLAHLTDRLPVLRGDVGLWKLFATVNRWVPAWRYAAGQSDMDEAADFVEAAGELLRWVDHNV